MSKQAQRSGLGLGRSLEHDILVCGTCLRQFSEIKPFILHKTHHVQGGNVYSCELCARAFSSHTVLLYHYRTLHQLHTWDPSTWGGTAASPASPAGPETVPGPEIPDTEPADPGMDVHFILTTETVKGRAFDYGRMVLKCLHCAQKYYSKEGLVGHVHAMHPGTEGLPLPQVALQGLERVMSVAEYEAYVKSVGRRSGSQKHESGRPLERPHGKKFVCPVCKKGFTRKHILQLHTSTHQAGCSPFCGTQWAASPRRLHQCQQCSFQSVVSAVAWLHRQEHRQGTVTCGVCHCAYPDQSTLNKHMRVHDAERPYGCSFPHCGWRFKSEVLLRAHLQAHVTPGQFECPSCGYAFRHKHHLQRHQARMHGIPSSRAKKPDVPPVAQLRRTQQGDSGTEPSARPLRRAESRMRASEIQDPPAMLAAALA
ncbi:ribonuclease-like [Platysternon megacephalum]|uniref:Ribonuclease-like n=1 Tax=Platysternon megacephalum TaxID=55544 RepID=A0A4D9DMH9_9SAUR|nr:ribonuclease-like [Platysternon megacephalum]